MRDRNTALRLALLAGTSVLALAVGSQNVSAADLPARMPMKAPPAAIYQPSWTWWIEGGAFDTAGNAVGTGSASPAFGATIPGLGGFRPNWGWEGAIGFDWKAQAFDPWHVSAQFRYGKAKKSKPYAANFAGAGTFTTGTTFTFAGSASANQDLREDHWLVDFAVGREFGLGTTKAQWKVGIRVADLRAKLTGNGAFAAVGATSSGGTTTIVGNFSVEQKSKFLGIGPRLGVEGETPLGGNLSLDWQAGVAVLFGKRTLDLTSTFTVTNPVVASISGTQSSSSNASVFNPDAQAGLSYWFNPNLKLTASYRIDAYFNALRTVDSGGNIVNVDRIYHGPMLRLTSKF